MNPVSAAIASGGIHATYKHISYACNQLSTFACEVSFLSLSLSSPGLFKVLNFTLGSLVRRLFPLLLLLLVLPASFIQGNSKEDSCISLEDLATGFVIIHVWIVPICPAQVEVINLQKQNSSDLLPKFRSLLVLRNGPNVPKEMELCAPANGNWAPKRKGGKRTTFSRNFSNSCPRPSISSNNAM